MDSRTRRQPTSARGFSLIELLIVVGIIVILVSISIAVGFKVAGSGKVRQTEQTLRVLDQSLTEMIAKLGGNPKPYVVDPRPGNNTAAQQSNPGNQYVQAVMDGINETDGKVINSVGLYMAQCKEFASVQETLKNLPQNIVKEYDADDNGNEGQANQQAPMLTVFDGWGNPIRYVHPAFAGIHPTGGSGSIQVWNTGGTGILKAPAVVNGVQRNFGIINVHRLQGDADCGFTPGNRPYFYSCGPDGKPDTTEDNIYLSEPTFSRQ